ncbi:MAG TPA: VOC family protein [Egibacteraceae bacterium]|nr:VOC family protein [Egibacteraceae bacterium]
MADHLDAVLDHVAIAVADWRIAERRWRDTLGAGRSSAGSDGVFSARQLRFSNGAKLELLSPAEAAGPDNFVRRFLDRFGTTVHHVTLKVPDLAQAIETLRAAGLDPVDVNLDNDYWKEAFLRPSQVGGLVVQVAQTPYSDDDWAAATGFAREPAREGAAALLGPTVRNPDLPAAAALWSALGADVTETESGLRCSWPDSPLDVVVEQGVPAGPVALRMTGSGTIDAEEGVGPAVVDVSR